MADPIDTPTEVVSVAQALDLGARITALEEKSGRVGERLSALEASLRPVVNDIGRVVSIVSKQDLILESIDRRLGVIMKHFKLKEPK